MTTKANSWVAQRRIPVSFESKKKWIVGSIAVEKGPITDVRYSNLKWSAVNIVADQTQLPRNEMKAAISTVGDPQSMADIEEVVVTSTGEKGWCAQCDLLKVAVGLMQKELGLIRARDTIAEVVAVVYDNIEFVHEGHSISKYGDVHDLRKQLRKSGKDVSGLNRAVVTSVAKFIDKKACDAGPAFDIICRFKSDRNNEVHSLPTFLTAKRAIEYYCKNNDEIPYEQKEYVQHCFLIFAEKACYLEQETNCYGNASTELDS